jgi:hypothetical protein
MVRKMATNPGTCAGAFKLSPEARALYAELSALYKAAYYETGRLPDNATRKQWAAERERAAKKRETFREFRDKALAKHCRSRGVYPTRPRRLTSLDQLVELAIIGTHSVEADRVLGDMIRKAVGLRA